MGEKWPQTLRLAGEALYGERWQSPLARDLGTTDRNLRYWITGKHSAPAAVKDQLVALLRRRGEKLSGIIARIEREEIEDTKPL